jgi:hypothetical protein
MFLKEQAQLDREAQADGTQLATHVHLRAPYRRLIFTHCKELPHQRYVLITAVFMVTAMWAFPETVGKERAPTRPTGDARA